MNNFFNFLKKALYVTLIFISIVTIYIVGLIQFSGDSTYSKTLNTNVINDITQLNPILVSKIIKPVSEDEIRKAIMSTTGVISIGGGKFSMGGQTAYEKSLHIDMRDYNQIISLDIDKQLITVQSGITWRTLQEYIDARDLSIKIMQTYANFTVGGSISVNCHGRYVGYGPIISSVKSLKIMLASGEVVTANRKKNKDIFNAVIGGYGGIGIILEATLELAKNVKVERFTETVLVADYNDYFTTNIANNKDVIFQNGDLYPPYYDKVMNISWKKSLKDLTDTERLTAVDENYWLEHRLVSIVSYGDFGKWVRKNIIDPVLYSFDTVVWRNKEASYDVMELEPHSRDKNTYVLNEYFIPVNNFEAFIPKMRKIFDEHDVNILNVSLRHAFVDDESYLAWAREEVYAFVVYYKQGKDAKAKKNVKIWTQEMSDAILSVEGRWYLPYQPHATREQFYQAYPDYKKYFKIKNQVDPEYRFTNKLLDKYNPNIKLENEDRLTKSSYKRPFEQTVLTIPEWYLVFNPYEYAEYLKGGNNPSEYSYYRSIDEYWKLYDRSMMLTRNYPKNEEYTTMLQVIGISTTMEYGFKLIYENTLGMFFSLFNEEEHSQSEVVITEAYIAYSEFIYNTAWYEFEFLPWVKKVWSAKEPTSNYSSIRKIERSLLFTLEFSFKAFYAQLIEKATVSTYETPEKNIYVLASSEEIIKPSKHLKIIEKSDNKYILAIPRWGIFTDTLVSLSESDIQIEEIAGNDSIVVSLLIEKNKNINPDSIEVLYESKVLSNAKVKRVVCLVSVKELLKFLRYCKGDNFTVEHIYDY